MHDSNKVQRLKKERIALEEQYDAESVTIDMLEQLVNELSDDYVENQCHSAGKISQMKYDHNVKMRHKEDLANI